MPASAEPVAPLRRNPVCLDWTRTLGPESQDPNARIRTAGQAGPLFLFCIEDRPHEALTSDATVRQRPGLHRNSAVAS
jgi:hypothetical protein